MCDPWLKVNKDFRIMAVKYLLIILMSMPRKPGLKSMQQNTSEISVNRSLVEHNLQEFGSFLVGLLGMFKKQPGHLVVPHNMWCTGICHFRSITPWGWWSINPRAVSFFIWSCAYSPESFVKAYFIWLASKLL